MLLFILKNVLLLETVYPYLHEIKDMTPTPINGEVLCLYERPDLIYAEQIFSFVKEGRFCRSQAHEQNAIHIL